MSTSRGSAARVDDDDHDDEPRDRRRRPVPMPGQALREAIESTADVPVSLQAMISCARRELNLRTRVYEKWVTGTRFTEAEAIREIHAQRAIVRTLLYLQGSSG